MNWKERQTKITTLFAAWFTASLLPVVLQFAGGCSSTPQYLADTYPPLPVPASPSAPILLGSGATASVASGIVYVKAINYTNHTVVLSRPGEEPMLLRIGPDAPNFNKVKVGDSLMTTTSESFIAYLVKPGVSPDSITNYLANTTPPDSQPGGVLIRNVDYHAKILVLDYASRLVVLQYGKDQARQVQVGPEVNLQDLHVNDDVFIRSTEAMAIAVTPPGS
jgi:hypothetical protein